MTGYGPSEQQMAVAINKIENLAGDMAEVKNTMLKLTDAVIKLGIIEERQAADRGALDRAFKLLEAHEKRIGSLELAQPMQLQTASWVNRIVVMIVSAVAGVLISMALTRPDVSLSISRQQSQASMGAK